MEDLIEVPEIPLLGGEQGRGGVRICYMAVHLQGVSRASRKLTLVEEGQEASCYQRASPAGGLTVKYHYILRVYHQPRLHRGTNHEEHVQGRTRQPWEGVLHHRIPKGTVIVRVLGQIVH